MCVVLCGVSAVRWFVHVCACVLYARACVAVYVLCVNVCVCVWHVCVCVWRVYMCACAYEAVSHKLHVLRFGVSKSCRWAAPLLRRITVCSL